MKKPLMKQWIQGRWYRILTLLLIMESPLCAGLTKLVDVQKYAPGVQVDCYFSTYINYTERAWYPNRCYVHRDAAIQLKKVQRDLEPHGLNLLIREGYRPLSIQTEMGSEFLNTNWSSNISKSASHVRGVAVDVTIVDQNGHELSMPSSYPYHTEESKRSYMDLSEEVIYNRTLLEWVMQKHGFESTSFNWWHFDLIGFENYEELDIAFSDIP